MVRKINSRIGIETWMRKRAISKRKKIIAATLLTDVFPLKTKSQVWNRVGILDFNIQTQQRMVVDSFQRLTPTSIVMLHFFHV